MIEDAKVETLFPNMTGFSWKPDYAPSVGLWLRKQKFKRTMFFTLDDEANGIVKVLMSVEGKEDEMEEVAIMPLRHKKLADDFCAYWSYRTSDDDVVQERGRAK